MKSSDPFNKVGELIEKDLEISISGLVQEISMYVSSLEWIQNVQRLDGSEAMATPSLVFGSMITHELDILEKRQNLLTNTGKFPSGKSKVLAEYRSIPQLQTLNQYAFEWCVGLMLGDASVKGTKPIQGLPMQARLKIQQTDKNISLLLFTKMVLLPYINKVFQPSAKQRPQMYELDTLTHPVFYTFVELFGEKEVVENGQTFKVKSVPQNIEKFLTPNVIGAWYCCDGGRRDYGPNEGKACQFHTQSFCKDDCNQLAKALIHRYHWTVNVKEDYVNNGQTFYRIQIEASSFESFKTIVQPYVLASFRQRFPKDRVSFS